MVRTPCCDKSGIKKGAWTPEEDQKLTSYIKRYGHWNWRELPKYAGLLRCGKSCRLRWMNYLRPNIKRGNYSQEEEELIIKLHESLGNKWSAIAAKLPRRTDNEIKNHWHSNLKKRLKQNPTASEAKLHSDETSQCETIEKKELEPTTSLPDDPTHQIIKSSLLSLQLSSSELSSLSSDSAFLSGTNWIAEDSIGSSEFWTEPYLAGNSYIQEDFPATLFDSGFLFPFSSVRQYGSYDDGGMFGLN